MPGGYDIGASLAGSSSATASISAPFNVTGGGGSSGGGQTKAGSYLPYALIGGLLLAVALLFFFKK